MMNRQALSFQWRKETHDERIARFYSYTMPVGDCLIWTSITRGKKGNERGQFQFNSKIHSAHRWIYSVFRRPLQPKEVVMHLCDNTLCVNLAHLKAGTQLENVRDAIAKKRAGSYLASIKPFCKRGHPRIPENLKLNRELNGKKQYECRVCKKERDRLAGLLKRNPNRGTP